MNAQRFTADALRKPRTTGEAAVQQRVQAVFAQRGIVIEVKNQARVHTWYRDWFGHDDPALRNARDGIDRFLVLGTCVAMQPGAIDPVVYAPYGLDAIYSGELAPNPLCDHPALYLRKAQDYAARWPGLHVTGASRSVLHPSIALQPTTTP